jgi:hypothetical protein
MLVLEDEKIGITRIILRQPKHSVLAVLSSFFEANRTLAAWLERYDASCFCEFEIQYQDGARLTGAYDPRRRGRGLPSLNSFILRCNLVNKSFLSQYEFSDPPKVSRKFDAAQSSPGYSP